MRTPMFRAWDKVSKQMCYDVQDHDYNHKGTDSFNGWEFADFLDSDDMVVMQYTGLKDKNGVEIYEGDLLFNNGHKPGLVRFDEGMFGVGDHLVPLHKYSGETKEVIGNIYENKDLLK